MIHVRRIAEEPTLTFFSSSISTSIQPFIVISHRPLGIHGDRIIKSHQVALLSYATPISPSPPLEWASSPSNPHPLAYHITCSTSTFGSSDPIEVSIQLSKKSLQAETPKRVMLELRREILFHSSDSPKMNTVSSMQASSSKANHSTVPKHSRSHSGNGLASFSSSSTLGGSKYKSESQEALITPPPLSNTSSTLSSFSVLAPTTPPAQVSTPAAEYAESIASESYFGLFNSSTSASRKSSIVDLSNTSKRQLHTQHSQQFSPSSVNLSLPAANTLPSKRKKEDITLATFETDCSFTSPTWHGTIKGTMPKAKSIYHYALGETCTTATATSRYYLVPKIQYKNKHSFIELSPIDVTFYTVSLEERKKAEEMKPKIMALQKAEAKLFGSAIGAITSPPCAEEVKEMKKVPNTRHSSSRRGQPQSHTNERNRISQSVSPKVGTGKSTQSLPSISTTSTSKDSKQATKETEEEEKVKLSTVRRRSEQAELSLLLDCPRTRQRFGSTPDLSPIVGSPYTDSVSPSLSAISSTSTTRPRTAAGHGHGNGRGSRPTTANSTKSSTARPRSSAGLDSSAWSTYSGSSGHFATFTIDPPLPSSSLLITGETSYTSSSTMTSSFAQLPPPLILESSMTTSSEDSSIDQSPRSASSKEISQNSAGTTMKNYTYTPSSSHNITSAAVNGLFADFSGFSLRPPDIMLPHAVPLIREEMIHPKSTTPIPSNSSANSLTSSAKRVNMTPPTSTSNKRKSTEILLNHDYPHGKIPHSPSLKLSSSSSSASSAVSSPIVALHEITLALPPASISMNPNASSTGNALLLQPNKPRSIPPMTRLGTHDATLEQAAASVIVLDSPAASTNAPGQRRSKGAMSGAFSFFRRSSARI